MKRKVMMRTLAVWTALTIVLGCVYVFAGAKWPPVADDYETRWDFRLGFFAFSFLPVLLSILLVTLLIESKYLSKKD